MRIYHLDPEGRPFGGFDSLSRQLWKERHYLIAAMNGGMYQPDLSPVGLFVEHGFERQAISTKSGWGNFHLLPNGVFWLKGGRAGVAETSLYLRERIAPDYATQSGPMLVIDGEIHPRFLPDSDSLKIRNGIGVDEKGRVQMVISEAPVRFYDFALLFRDQLGCRNALYLDGTISSLYVAGTSRRDGLFPLGPIIAVIGTVR
ncbi:MULTISPECIES: phosphodiester glycosidase family protein [Alphaproteobacteria]|uniref:Lipoprotein signal peptide n=2 Tax=Alphaproteobacteria TaxID=28211 RepID=A0A512HD59_9HYPH|nr:MULTISPECIES: phosphodiester glycosidase family protein [Alphaproteobacteria]GEO83386.1 lipoprotein signal peptide [Ciceribacter naphthalenivorans]GLR20220.1 lipoprotein signal peptide [Ciceribacter naphthalenivorans]GLT03076.1 lipoprotein signal peptide [Sphingomonas psychrolutea]